LIEIIQKMWPVILLAGFFIGLDKGGFKPVSVVAMYLISRYYSSLNMLSIFAPILLLGEIYPTIHYHSDYESKSTWKFLPWVLIGLTVGGIVGKYMNEEIIGICIAICVLLMAVLTTWMDFHKIILPKKYESSFTIILGISAGLASIIGSVGAAVSNVYFLNKTKSKRSFIGSSSLIYIFVNIFKVLVYFLFWGLFSKENAYVSILMIPGIIVGIVCSVYLIKVIPEKLYRFIILASIGYSSIAFLLLIL